jgi:glycosyltransferase involved in cell wall biosynthesis
MKISVLTPSFNSEKYIIKSIESVLSQTYHNWEHIIVDGNSQDSTVSILKQYQHLKWISEKDKGQSDAMNKAFNMASGDIIVYLNSDDYFYPNAFSIIIGEFRKDKNCNIVVGNLHTIKNGITSLSSNATIDWKDLSIIKGRFPLNPVSYFYKREVQEKTGNFPVNEHYTMDYWFLLRAFYFFKPIKIDENLGCFVFDGNNKTSVIKDGFSIQIPHALKFCLYYTPGRLPYVLYNLLVHSRNKSKTSKIFKISLNYLRRVKNKLSLTK